MKLSKSNLSIAIILIIGSLTIQAQDKVENDTEFLFAIVEVEDKKDRSIGINVLNSKIIAHPLKTPVESNGNLRKSNALAVTINDDNGVVLDEIIYSDVFTTDFEYVNEDGKYQHYVHKSKKKVILIRKVIDKNATNLSFLQGGSQKSNSIHNFNFR